VRLGDPELGQQERDRLGALRRAAIGVQRQDLRGDLLLGGRLLDRACAFFCVSVGG